MPIHLSPGGMERSWGGKKGEGAASNWSQFHPRDLRILFKVGLLENYKKGHLSR